jgi:Family of unknown function (DUF5985)
MNNLTVNQFLFGAIVISCLIIGLFFLRFYRRTGDRLLAIFAISFWVLAVNWVALAFTNPQEDRVLLYVVRLLAFLFILVGILDKNRAKKSGGPVSDSP